MLKLPFGWRLTKQPVPQPSRAAYPRIRQRSYKAGDIDRLTAEWATTPTTSDELLMSQLTRLRARSRQQIRNNPYASKFAESVPVNVIGHKGIVLRAMTKDSTTGGLDREVNLAIQDAWNDWGESKECDITGRQNFVQMQKLCVDSVVKDGEAILRIYKGKQWGRFGFAMQLIDAERLDVNYNTVLTNGDIIRMGVEMTPYRKPLAYHILNDTNRIIPGISTQNRKRERVPASEIIHIYLKTDVDQTRGCPWLATSLYRLRMLGEAEDAALVAFRIGASQMGALERDETKTESFKGAADAETDEGELEWEVEPGVWRALPPGYKLSDWTPNFPRGDLEPFMRAMLRGISSGVPTSYPTISNDLENVNYTSIRHALGNERDCWMVIQGFFSSEMSHPVFLPWLGLQLTAGTITLDGEPLNIMREQRYRRVSWRGRRWPWIDPQKEIAAAEIAIRCRVKSRFSIIRDQSQEDPEDVIEEIAEEEKLLKEKGLLTEPAKAEPPELPPKEDKEDET